MTSPTTSPVLLLPPAETQAAIDDLAGRIAEAHPTGDNVMLIGVQTGGVRVARQLAPALAPRWGRPGPVGELDVTMHRDDLDQRVAPAVHPTSIPGDIADKNVILVDDVFSSGRTIRAALDALHDLGRPRRIQVAVLIERPHLELPIRVDFVGRQVQTSLTDLVTVEPADANGALQVLLEPGAADAKAPS